MTSIVNGIDWSITSRTTVDLESDVKWSMETLLGVRKTCINLFWVRTALAENLVELTRRYEFKRLRNNT